VENDSVQRARAARQMARSLLGMGSTKKAVQFALLSIDLFSELSHLREKAISAQIASEAYEVDGDLKSAVDFTSIAQDIFESIADERKREALTTRITKLQQGLATKNLL
jgi:hypothetical protein